MNPYIPKHLRERQRPIDDKVRLDLEWQSWNWNVREQLVAGFFFFFYETNWWTVKRMVRTSKDGKDGENDMNKYSLFESSVILHDSCTFVVFVLHGVSLTGNSDSLVSDGEGRCKHYTAPRQLLGGDHLLTSIWWSSSDWKEH